MKTVQPPFGLVLGVLFLAAVLPAAQEQAAPPVLAVVNARLIDGTGAAPVDDAVIVITGGSFTAAVVDNMRYYPGLYFKETDQFVAWGYTPMETIVAATKIGAQVCAAADRLGTIEAGKLADLVILDKDPLADIANLRSAAVVIQGGRIVKGADGL